MSCLGLRRKCENQNHIFCRSSPPLWSIPFHKMVGFLFFVSIFVLSQAATLIRFANAHALVICFWRQLFASILLVLPLLLHKGYRDYRKLNSRDLWLLPFSGFLLFIHFFFFFKSVQETTVTNSIILFCLNPVSTAIGAYIFFREKFSAHLVAASILGFVGVLCLLSESFSIHNSEAFLANILTTRPTFTGPHQSTLAGNIWGILSAVTFSAYILSEYNKIFLIILIASFGLFMSILMTDKSSKYLLILLHP